MLTCLTKGYPGALVGVSVAGVVEAGPDARRTVGGAQNRQVMPSRGLTHAPHAGRCTLLDWGGRESHEQLN